jgi:hypothetical protein
VWAVLCGLLGWTVGLACCAVFLNLLAKLCFEDASLNRRKGQWS